MSTPVATLSTVDIVIMVVFFVFVVMVGLTPAIFKFIKRKIFKIETTNELQDYFLANQSINWILVGASLFTSNIGSEHLVGITGSASVDGLPVAYFEIAGSSLMLLLGFVYAPVYLRNKLMTTPEYLEKRFSPTLRTLFAGFCLLYYIFSTLSVCIYSAAIVFETILGWNFWISVPVILGITGCYTILGGFHAVIWTELVQTIVLLIGSIILMVLSYEKVGGLPEIMKKRPDAFHLMRPASDPHYPWPGFLFGIPISGIWYWVANQVIVQRVLASKSIDDAKLGTCFAGLLKYSQVFMFAIPGIIAGYLFPREIAEDSNRAFTLLVANLMPPILKGIMISAMISATMSSLTSTFNSATTIFVVDVLKRLKPNTSEAILVRNGKLFGVGLILVSICWMPFIKQFSNQIYIYAQIISSFLTPPIAVLFLGGMLSSRITTAGAMVSTIVGFIFGAIRIVFELMNQGKSESEVDWLIWTFSKMNYLHFGMILFSVCMASMIFVSFVTREEEEKIGYSIPWTNIWKDKVKPILKKVGTLFSKLNASRIFSREQEAAVIQQQVEVTVGATEIVFQRSEDEEITLDHKEDAMEGSTGVAIATTEAIELPVMKTNWQLFVTKVQEWTISISRVAFHFSISTSVVALLSIHLFMVLYFW